MLKLVGLLAASALFAAVASAYSSASATSGVTARVTRSEDALLAVQARDIGLTGIAPVNDEREKIELADDRGGDDHQTVKSKEALRIKNNFGIPMRVTAAVDGSPAESETQTRQPLAPGEERTVSFKFKRTAAAKKYDVHYRVAAHFSRRSCEGRGQRKR